MPLDSPPPLPSEKAPSLPPIQGSDQERAQNSAHDGSTTLPDPSVPGNTSLYQVFTLPSLTDFFRKEFQRFLDDYRNEMLREFEKRRADILGAVDRRCQTALTEVQRLCDDVYQKMQRSVNEYQKEIEETNQNIASLNARLSQGENFSIMGTGKTKGQREKNKKKAEQERKRRQRIKAKAEEDARLAGVVSDILGLESAPPDTHQTYAEKHRAQQVRQERINRENAMVTGGIGGDGGDIPSLVFDPAAALVFSEGFSTSFLDPTCLDAETEFLLGQGQGQGQGFTSPSPSF